MVSDKVSLQKHHAGHSSLLSPFSNKATHRPQCPCAFRSGKHLILQGQHKYNLPKNTVLFLALILKINQLRQTDSCKLNFSVSITVLLWIATKFNFSPHSRPCRGTLVFPGYWSSASRTPASPIKYPALPQQCRQREWVSPDNLVVWYTPCWQHRRAPFKTTSGYFNREVLQDHIRWNKKYQLWTPHGDSGLSFPEGQMQPTTAALCSEPHLVPSTHPWAPAQHHFSSDIHLLALIPCTQQSQSPATSPDTIAIKTL